MHIEIHYLPSMEYVSLLLKSETIIFEAFENFPKQTYRNRCKILSANGLLPLVVPIQHSNGNKIVMKEVQIDYSQPWQKQHKGAIQAAYGKSAFFEHISPLFFEVYDKKSKYLLDLNIELLNVIFKVIGKPFNYTLSSDFESIESPVYNLVHPKRKIITNEYRYRQCFGTEFVESLSVLDCLMNHGRKSLDILGRIEIEQI